MRTALTLLVLTACSGGRGPSVPGENILVLISDDIGRDKTGAFGSVNETFTPNLDALAATGMRFNHVYSNPTCSPSRTTLLTGRLASRTGIGRWIFPDTERWDMSLDEVTIPEMLDHSASTYTAAVAGKWHTVRFTRSNPSRHPLRQGFEYHRGGLANPLDATMSGNTPRSYTNWEKNVDGEVEWSETYMTTDTVNEAIALMDEMPEPWFLWVAFNAAHTPWHVPPDDLNPMGVTDDSTDVEKYDADTLAWDMELGRLLDSIDPEVREELTIVYIADNGSPNPVIIEPYNDLRGKASEFEGGVNVPMIVAGPHVAEPGSASDAMVHFADLFPTVAEIAGVDAFELTYDSGPRRGERLGLDGQSFLPLLADPTDLGTREFLFSEAFYPNGGGPYEYRRKTVRNHTHKVRRRVDIDGNVTDWFYRLDGGQYDEGDALDVTTLSAEDQAQHDLLMAELARLEADLTFDW